jgi:predicted nucleic acid-binding protein
MIVMDCSAAVNIVQETLEGQALMTLALADEEVISSQMLYIEACSAIRKYVRAGITNAKSAQEHLDKIVRLVDRFVDISENYQEAFAESLRLGHSPYDLLYFTLARRNGATLFTTDKKLIELCEREGVDCIHEVLLDEE